MRVLHPSVSDVAVVASAASSRRPRNVKKMKAGGPHFPLRLDGSLPSEQDPPGSDGSQSNRYHGDASEAAVHQPAAVFCLTATKSKAKGTTRTFRVETASVLSRRSVLYLESSLLRGTLGGLRGQLWGKHVPDRPQRLPARSWQPKGGAAVGAGTHTLPTSLNQLFPPRVAWRHICNTPHLL